MEKIQVKTPQKNIKPISFYHKYNCETCQYHTNFKNSFNKHTKSAKHISLNPSTEVEETVQTVCDTNVVEEKKSINREALWVFLTAIFNWLLKELNYSIKLSKTCYYF